MTRKRFKKLLMSGGIPRNVADKYLRINEITMPGDARKGGNRCAHNK